MSSEPEDTSQHLLTRCRLVLKVSAVLPRKVNSASFLCSKVYGKDVPAVIEQPLEEEHAHIGKNTVTYEARTLKALFYEVIGWND